MTQNYSLLTKISKLMVWFIVLNFTGLLVAQNPNVGVYLSWDKEAACQVWTEDEDDKRYNDLDFDDSDCLRVCANSQVVFEIHNLDTSVTVNWNIDGGGGTIH